MVSPRGWARVVTRLSSSTVSLLAEAEVVFGDSGGRIELLPNGQLDGYSFPLPRRSVLLSGEINSRRTRLTVAQTTSPPTTCSTRLLP
eukprot:747476-Hanusia_phi.AAC.1